MSTLSLPQWAEIATIVTPLVAVLGLGGIWLQVRAANIASDTATATQFYTILLSKSLEYPQFIAPDKQLVHIKNQTFGKSEIEFRRYETFLDLMVTTFDEMQRLGPTDEAGEDYKESWIEPHLSYYKSQYFKENFKKQLSPYLKRLIANASKRANKAHRLSFS